MVTVIVIFTRASYRHWRLNITNTEPRCTARADFRNFQLYPHGLGQRAL